MRKELVAATIAGGFLFANHKGGSDDSHVVISLYDVIKSRYRRPSSRLEDLVKVANDRCRNLKTRAEAVRLIALYSKQWKHRRKQFSARMMSADTIVALSMFGHRIEETFFNKCFFKEEIVYNTEIESIYLKVLQNLLKMDKKLNDCSIVFVNKALREFKNMDAKFEKSLVLFKPDLDFWPFGCHVSDEEITEKPLKQENISLSKTELFLRAVLKCLEYSSRDNDIAIVQEICFDYELVDVLGIAMHTLQDSSNCQRLFCAIVANLMSFSDDVEFVSTIREKLVKNGAFTQIRKWALQDQPKSVVLEAIRALQNLDPLCDSKLKSSIVSYYPIWRSPFSHRFDGKKAVVDVVFVHGVQGGAVFTWRSRYSGYCWPADWLPFDVDNQHVRFFGIQYHSVLPGLSECIEPLEFRARHLMQDLEQSGVGKDKDIVWVTHSFGGIFVKSILLQSEEFRRNTKAVVFLSTPHRGSPIADQPAKYASLLGLALDELDEIRTDSPHLLQLQKSFVDQVAEHGYRVLSVSETAPTYLLGSRLALMVVPEESAFGASVGEKLMAEPETDHLSTCKPVDKTCSIYQSITRLINQVLFDKLNR